MDNDVLILDAQQVVSLLQGQETPIVDLIAAAYLAHREGDSALPHSSFVNFPGKQRERIIALPAFLGGGFNVAGMKWIASFPENARHGIDRASAVIVLNSMEDGRPRVIMEGATISAKRTAASAALAARALKREGDVAPVSAALIGCGPINLEIARFVAAVEPRLERFVLFDLVPANAARQRDQLRALFPQVQVHIAASSEEALRECSLVSLATTAVVPHITDLSLCRPDATILHVSLRDLTADCIAACDNTVDDIDHVFRANTSLHLAEKASGTRDCVRCTLADILAGAAPARTGGDALSVFSPFGLGILDLALAQWVAQRAVETGVGTRLPFFLPAAAPAPASAPRVDVALAD
jgi:2,3-diaminopropionate biosynthesis protein SbnB